MTACFWLHNFVYCAVFSRVIGFPCCVFLDLFYIFTLSVWLLLHFLIIFYVRVCPLWLMLNVVRTYQALCNIQDGFQNFGVFFLLFFCSRSSGGEVSSHFYALFTSKVRFRNIFVASQTIFAPFTLHQMLYFNHMLLLVPPLLADLWPFFLSFFRQPNYLLLLDDFFYLHETLECDF